MNILKEADYFKHSIIEDYNYLHSIPELGFDLHLTTEYIKKRLREVGYAPRDIGKSGITATIGDTKKRCMLLRADMDALPITEKTDLSHSSKNGNMHACGHDIHSAMLLGAAQILKKNEHLLPCCVKLLFQPAEEILEGAKDCIDAGILNNPPVENAFMLHLLTGIEMPSGSIIISSGGIGAPAALFYQITIEGKSAHSGAPKVGVDGIKIAAQIINAIYNNISERDGDTRFTVTVGKIQGGCAANTIADRCVIEGTVRSYDDNEVYYLLSRIKSMAETISKSQGGNATTLIKHSCPILKNDGALSYSAYKYLTERFDNVYLSSEFEANEKSNKAGGSEDFSYIAEACPSLMIALCAGSPTDGYGEPLHTPKTAFDEGAFSIGAAVYASLPFLEF